MRKAINVEGIIKTENWYFTANTVPTDSFRCIDAKSTGWNTWGERCSKFERSPYQEVTNHKGERSFYNGGSEPKLP